MPHNISSKFSFNSRTRKGCDRAWLDLARLGVVSIHAPVKGATARQKAEYEAKFVSIHAPVKGATSTGVERVIIP